MANIPELHRLENKSWRYQLAKYEKDWQRLPPWVRVHWEVLAYGEPSKKTAAELKLEQKADEMVAISLLQV